MTLKLTIQYNEKNQAFIYVTNNARVLVGNDIVAAKEATSISLLSKVEFKGDNMLHAMNNVILPVVKVEQVDNVVTSYIDPAKITNLNFPVAGVFLLRKKEQKENKKGYKLYFAMMQECNNG